MEVPCSCQSKLGIAQTFFNSSCYLKMVLFSVSEAEIRSIEFENNQAGEDGGALSVHLFSSINIIGSNFVQNEARDGGGLHIGVSYQEKVRTLYAFELVHHTI